MVSMGAEQKESPVCTPMRVDIFNEAYGDHVVVCVAYYLELKLFPAAYALLNEHLTYKAGLESAGADYLQLVDVVDHDRRLRRPWCKPDGAQPGT